MSQDKGFEFKPRQVINDRYEILEKIGSGGISSVYTAKDLLLKRVLALKVLKPDKLKDEHLVRLHREAKAICQLQHSGIIDVYDFIITDDNIPLLAMEYVQGRELSRVIEDQGSLSAEEALPIFIQIANAMNYAHERNTLHRDLKPENVLVTDDTYGNTRVKIFDFGIAKISDLEDDSITRSGFIVGTPAYISPEQAKNEDADQRSDIYSMGCLMFKALTGKPPFRGKNLVETVNMQINSPAPEMKQVSAQIDIPEALESLVRKTLEKSPADRPQSMAELAEYLSRIREELLSIQGDEEGEDSPEPVNQEKDPVGKRRVVETSLVLILLLVFLAFPIYALLSTRQDAPKADSNENELSSTLKKYGIRRKRINDNLFFSLEGKVEDDQLDALKLVKPERMDLKNAVVNDKQLKYLETLPLKVLDMRNTGIGDDAMIHIGKITGLQSLLLEGCHKISSKGFKELGGLENLVVLSLRDTNVSDKDMEVISELGNIRMLYISKSPNITDKTVPELLKLKKLVSVRMGGTKITEVGIAGIQKHDGLSFIGLKDLKIDDKKMPKAFNPNLTMLDLSDNLITDGSIPKLLKLKNLWFLDVRGCPNLSAVGTNRLCKQFPLSEKKLVFSDMADTLAKFAMVADNEWYLDPRVYLDTSWNSQRFREEYVTTDFLFTGKRPHVKEME